MKTQIFFDGQVYPSVEAMPESVRQEYHKALGQLADSDGNGIPDILERQPGAKQIVIRQSSITVNDETLNDIGSLPTVIRRLFDHAKDREGENQTGTPDRRERFLAAIDRVDNSLDRFLRAFLIVAAVAILAGAVFIMVNIDGGSNSQGGRWFVAVLALVAIGAVDTQYARLVWRRAPFSLTEFPICRHYRITSALLLLAAALILLGSAWLLP